MEVYIVFVCENGEYIGHGLYEDQSYVYGVFKNQNDAIEVTNVLQAGLYEDQSYVYGVFKNQNDAIEVTNVLQAKGENAYMQPFTVE